MKKVLVLRFSSIGDIELTTPVLRCLKKQTDYEVHYVTKKSFASILEHNPYVDHLWTFEQSAGELIPKLKRVNFDFIVDLHNNIRTLKLKLRLGVKSKAFPKLNVQKWLYVNFKLDTMTDQKHVVDRYFEAVQPLGVQNDHQGLDFFLSPQDQIDAQTVLPESFRHGFAVFTLGAQFKTKCLPESKVVDLLAEIRSPVVLLGGKEDQALGERLENQFPEEVINFAGKLTLGQSASLLKHAQCVIAHDTGLMHIASAFQKPIAVIWGNTTPQIGMYPYEVKATVEYFEVDNLACRPCSKIGFQACPKIHFRCMIDQNTAQIAAFADSF